MFIDNKVFIGKRGREGYGIVCATRTEFNNPVVTMIGDFGTTTAELGRALAEHRIEKALPERKPDDQQTMMQSVFRVSSRANTGKPAKLVYGPRMYKLEEDGWTQDFTLPSI